MSIILIYYCFIFLRQALSLNVGLAWMSENSSNPTLFSPSHCGYDRYAWRCLALHKDTRYLCLPASTPCSKSFPHTIYHDFWTLVLYIHCTETSAVNQVFCLHSSVLLLLISLMQWNHYLGMMIELSTVLRSAVHTFRMTEVITQILLFWHSHRIVIILFFY